MVESFDSCLTRWSPVHYCNGSERTDRRLLHWYAMRRVVESLFGEYSAEFYLCTSRTRPIVRIDSLGSGLNG